MKAFTLLQMPEHVAMQSDMLAEIDPHGIILSTTSILMVFLSLLILFIAYLLIGKCVKKIETREKNCPKAAHHNTKTDGNDSIHDKESYIITIRRKPKDSTHIESCYTEDCTIIPGLSATAASENIAESTEGHSNTEKGIIKSPLPGVITGIKVKIGDNVTTGQEVAYLEAMKMENAIEAEHDGTVTDIFISKGDSVLEGTPIIKIL